MWVRSRIRKRLVIQRNNVNACGVWTSNCLPPSIDIGQFLRPPRLWEDALFCSNQQIQNNWESSKETMPRSTTCTHVTQWTSRYRICNERNGHHLLRPWILFNAWEGLQMSMLCKDCMQILLLECVFCTNFMIRKSAIQRTSFQEPPLLHRQSIVPPAHVHECTQKCNKWSQVWPSSYSSSHPKFLSNSIWWWGALTMFWSMTFRIIQQLLGVKNEDSLPSIHRRLSTLIHIGSSCLSIEDVGDRATTSRHLLPNSNSTWL